MEPLRETFAWLEDLMGAPTTGTALRGFSVTVGTVNPRV